MMAFLFGLFLMVAGTLAAASFLSARVPAMVPYIAKIKLYEEGLGAASAGVGILGIIVFLVNIGYYFYVPAMGALNLCSNLVLLGLGLIMGLVFISKRLQDPTVSFPILPRLEGWRLKLLPYRTVMGQAAILFGLVYVVMAISRLFE